MVEHVLKMNEISTDVVNSTTNQTPWGLPINPISNDELRQYMFMALKQVHSTTLASFIDIKNLCSALENPKTYSLYERIDCLIPRGKGINIKLNANTSNKAPTDQLYREILLTLEESHCDTTLIMLEGQHQGELERVLTEFYPALKHNVVTIKKELPVKEQLLACKETIYKTDAGAVLCALPSPLQEEVVANSLPSPSVRFLMGMGLPFIDSVSDLNKGNPISRFRHSVLLSPKRLFQSLTLRKQYEKTKPAKTNSLFSRWGFIVKGSRTLSRLRSTMWVMRCKMQRNLKRVMDLICVTLGLIALIPLLLPVALLIKLTSPGPLFYSQVRVGMFGKTFRMWKFRSMYIDADARKAALLEQNESSAGVLFKMKKDPRITPVGRILRRLSIDELPQLYNVLIGDMSLVGPRPALESEVAEYPVLARARLEVLPGLTGLWQISGRSDLPFDKQVLLDTTYVNQQSITNDIKLIAKTVPAVVSGKGAY